MILEIARGRVPAMSAGANNFVDVRDVCRGMIAAWELGKTGERYILGGDDLSYADVFRRIAAIVGAKPPRFSVPRWLAAPLGWAGDVQERWSDREATLSSNTLAWGYATNFKFTSAKARRELGYTTGPLDDAIRDAVASFRGRGML
jgi:dihydroflavonol-4-reductase